MKSLVLLLAAAGSMMAAAALAATMNVPAVGGGAYRVPVTSLKEARFRTTTRQQYDFSCGSAAVATLLTHHYGFPVSEQIVFEQMYAHGDRQKIRMEGFSLLDIKRFLEAQGFLADGFKQPLDKLENAHLPAIVLISDKGYHHFVIIKGIRDGRVLVGDPSAGTRAIPRERFETLWVNQLLFVIHNNQDRAVFNDKADWRVAPKGPLAAGVSQDGLGNATIPKLGPSDF